MKLFGFDSSKGIAVVEPEDPEDLWALRRMIRRGDRVASSTTRVVKREGDFVRPNKGERVRVFVTLKVNGVKLDSGLARLRLSGVIEEASNELLPKGSSHSIIVTPDDKITIAKDEWNDVERRLLKQGEGAQDTFYIIAVDRREASLGVVKGTRMHVYPPQESGTAGKAYKHEKASIDVFFKELSNELLGIYAGERILIVGPGNTKNVFANHLISMKPELEGAVQIVEGIDTAGEDGVLMALKSEGVKQLVKDSKIGKASALLDEAMRRISKGDERVALSFNDSNKAAELGAVESVLMSDKIFERNLPEEEIVAFLNKVESRRGKTFLVDMSSSVGVQVSGLGGIVGLLRFPIQRAN